MEAQDEGAMPYAAAKRYSDPIYSVFPVPVFNGASTV
jgi:hypothetical protein